MAEDLYQVLGVGKTADKDEIQKSYRKLARKYHPDLNPDDKSAQEKFKRIQEAYDVLSDSDKRAAYDRYGSDFERVRQGGGSWDGGGFEGVDVEQIFGGRGGGGFQGGFGDFFEQLFGQQGGPRGTQQRTQRQVRGSDIRADVSIPFSTAILGGKTELQLGQTGGPSSISVSIPPGVETGSKIRLRGQGQASRNGGPKGDLILEPHRRPPPIFSTPRQAPGFETPLTISEAMLGTKVDVPTPGGTIALTIPPASSEGKRLRIKGQGVRDSKGDAGDLFVEIQIKLPQHIDEQSEQLIRDFAARNPMQPRESLIW
ncbi:MAG: J domain-containing protein [Pirellulaceae bacterium]